MHLWERFVKACIKVGKDRANKELACMGITQ